MVWKKSGLKLTHPEDCLFADKTRCNSSMKKDGHVAGTKYITAQGTQAQLMTSTSEGRFTVLPFIFTNGQLVCCVVIFQSNFPEPKMEWGKGIDITVDLVRQSDGKIYIIASCGPGKHYHGGPQCTFNNKTIVCFTFCSKSGRITTTTEILIKVLEYLIKIMSFLEPLEVQYHFSL